jgi:hypothetical protein
MTDLQPLALPAALECWTADEVANCLSYNKHLPPGYVAANYGGNKWGLCSRLEDIAHAATNPTPMGGDGSNGTVETPDGRLDLDNDDKALHWWNLLAPAEQHAISAAYAAEYPAYETAQGGA